MAADITETEEAAAAETAVAPQPELAVDEQQQQLDAAALAKAQDDLRKYIDELRTKIQNKSQLRAENLSCTRPTETYFTKLDSNLKKNTAFVKKLKQFTASQLDALLKDMQTLNLTKYISEISASLIESKLKMTDIPAALTLCSRLHQLYAEFAGTFFENWQKVLALKPNEKCSNPSKLRVDLRFFAELIAIGIFSNKIGLPLLGNTLTNLISQDKDDHSNLTIILSFCRHCGEEYAGLIQKSHIDTMQTMAADEDIEMPKSTLLAPDKQQNLRNLLKDYFAALCRHVKAEHKSLMTCTQFNRKLIESKGEISVERREKLELMQNNFDKLYGSVQAMADLLNESMPNLPKDEETTKCGMVLDMIDDSADKELDPWGDDETKSFYVDLPDLRNFLPNYAPKQSSLPPEEPTMTEDALDMDIEPDQLQVDEASISEESLKPPTPEPIIAQDELSGSSSVTSTTAATAITSTNTTTTSTTTTTTSSSSGGGHATRQQFDTFLHNLSNCVNKELIDSAAIEFLLNLNTRVNRKKLTNALFGVQRTRLDLLPFYARFVATINLVAQDVAIELVQKLKNEFKYHITKKNQMNIESKIKIVRFIGEMAKFNLYSRIEALFCLKILLHDFQHHHIEMTCAFLDVAGQYLYNCKESRLRINVYLEQMMRLKTATALDSRYSAQIENSYYLVKPPEYINAVQKIRLPMHLYIKHLIFDELNKTNVDKIIKLMRKLNWDDATIADYAIKSLSKAYNIRYHLIRCLADLLSGISSYQDKIVVKVIDTVFEDIRAGLEIHSPKLAQRRIAMAKYLGELYNYRLIESSNILNTLYSIISLGVTLDHSIHSELDPADSLFRLKLACVLLDTCGQYFTSGISRKRLDYFLVFFQQYYWYKKSHPIYQTATTSSTTSDNTIVPPPVTAPPPSSTTTTLPSLFPILADNHYKECLINVRPKLKLYKSYDDAKDAVEKLRVQLYPNLFKPTSLDGAGDDISELDTIAEIDAGGDMTADDNNEFTEDTSEAVGDSDDEVRGGGNNDDDADNENDDGNTSPTMDTDADVLLEPRRKEKERTQEDIDFEREFEKMTADSYQERLRDTIIPNTKDIPVPIMAKSGGKKTYDQLQSSSASASASSLSATSTGSISKSYQSTTADNTVPFVLMLRGTGKGNNKQQLRTFAAPNDSALAINLRLQEQKIREENEKVKRLTLNITERIEEEDYQISLLQSQRSPAESRGAKQPKQHRYKHQKGAPDADLIFG